MTRILALCKFTHAPTNHWLTGFSNHLRLLRSMTYKEPNNSWDLLKLCTNGQRQLSIAAGSSKGEIHSSWADTANSLISYVLTVTVCPFFSVVWHVLVNPLIQCNYNLITEGILWLKEEKKGVRAPFQCFLLPVYLCVTNLIFSKLPSSQAFFKHCSLFHRVLNCAFPLILRRWKNWVTSALFQALVHTNWSQILTGAPLAWRKPFLQNTWRLDDWTRFKGKVRHEGSENCVSDFSECGQTLVHKQLLSLSLNGLFRVACVFLCQSAGLSKLQIHPGCELCCLLNIICLCCGCSKEIPLQMNEHRSLVITGYCSSSAGFERKVHSPLDSSLR